MSASVGLRVRRQQRDGGHDLAGLAEAALGDVLVDPGLLHGVEGVAVGQPFDGGDRRGPAQSATGVMQGWKASPSRWLVQARQTPTPQPYLGPVTPEHVAQHPQQRQRRRAASTVTVLPLRSKV